MKKSNFVAMILSVIGVLFLGLGMCMCLLPEWNLFGQGIVVGCVGFAVLLAMVIIYRKMEGKAPIRITAKTIFTVLFGMVGALALGVGMCLTMVGERYVSGIIVGVVGIVLLVGFIPVCKGIK